MGSFFIFTLRKCFFKCFMVFPKLPLRIGESTEIKKQDQKLLKPIIRDEPVTPEQVYVYTMRQAPPSVPLSK